MKAFLPILSLLSILGTILISAGHTKDDSAILVYVDLETTGLSIKKCEVLQIAAKSEDSEFNKFILPQSYIPKRVTALNHISKRNGKLYYNDEEVPTTDMQNALRSFIEFLKNVAASEGRIVLVAHNGDRFDYPIILREMKRYDLLKSFLEVAASSIDSLRVLKAKLPGQKSYKLETLAEHYGIGTDDAHNALADVRILEQVIHNAAIQDSELESYAKELSNMRFPDERM